MAMSILFIVFCLLLGGFAAIAMKSPMLLPGIGASLKDAQLKQFSPKRTLFIFGPTPNHPACRLQRRLLKPAVAALMRDDISIMEVYGNERPRKNGEDVDWLDPSLLRHAMSADGGFWLVYVDESGKSALRSEAPVLAADLLDRAGLEIALTPSSPRRRSAVLKRLRAA
jgi:hypothetical protein